MEKIKFRDFIALYGDSKKDIELNCLIGYDGRMVIGNATTTVFDLIEWDYLVDFEFTNFSEDAENVEDSVNVCVEEMLVYKFMFTNKGLLVWLI
ncbi:hypothetical protein [Capybara microvirus Cap3_SP_478]|nr:hypothetical protein [Capybara microvirus Cap3_SP_478]